MGKTDDSLYFSVKTRGNSSPQRKPRVYFCCHPADFDKYFDKVCEDIFALQDCAIYYTGDMSSQIPEEYKESDLGQMNLFVVPVTFKLMYEDNRAMRDDIEFAKNGRITILPLMMEPGLEQLYSLENNFGNRQYLDPYAQDITAISYEEKLKKFLSSVLVDDETAEKIRKAFDAYIFLSYRKKDRQHANELIKIIHNEPRFQSVAVWYDEFLIPGQDFESDIKSALEKSSLFALLVTPSLLEKGNYVETNEYPAAVDAKMSVLPVEMVETDGQELKKAYKNIPECSRPYDREFTDRMAESLSHIARTENGTPEHDYYIGLAYLEGIDTEINIDRGIKLLTQAGEADCPEAMEKLCDIYFYGVSGSVSYENALYWAKKHTDYCFHSYGDKDVRLLDALEFEANITNLMGNDKYAITVYKEKYEVGLSVLGEDCWDAYSPLYEMIPCLFATARFGEALWCARTCFRKYEKILGKYDERTLSALSYYAQCLDDYNDNAHEIEDEEEGSDWEYDWEDGFDIRQELAERYKKLLDINRGEPSYETINIKKRYAELLLSMFDYEKALQVSNEVLADFRSVLGNESYEVISALKQAGTCLYRMRRYDEALTYFNTAFELTVRKCGEHHPKMIDIYDKIDLILTENQREEEAIAYAVKSLILRIDFFGIQPVGTHLALYNLLDRFNKKKRFDEMIDILKTAIDNSIKKLGEKHEYTLLLKKEMGKIIDKKNETQGKGV